MHIFGIDLHGVLDTYPNIFKPLCINLLSHKGFKVVVVSGPQKEKVIEELNVLGYEKNVHYSDVYSVVDFLKTNNEKMWQDKNGDWWADKNIWWGSKALICEKYNIEMLIDNDNRYSKSFDNIKCNFININKIITNDFINIGLNNLYYNICYYIYHYYQLYVIHNIITI